jgi:hypothetical protein
MKKRMLPWQSHLQTDRLFGWTGKFKFTKISILYNLVFIDSILGLLCESVQLQAMLGFGLPA